ncbi:uncharacterized protein LOC109709354 isoform X1 [Ananas comosus]|uniref:Uncharacterized protein LOC109709354 isoform X1 n=1 Tax=Ananas comosus TaxID=4615 RepID=A0A6P5EUB8_ANACO|nr:uncharacterized protein LOC109709354 isoform X1 [Ananas comosus]
MAEGAAASVARLRVSDNNRKKPAAKITLKSADMAEEMREEVFCCARAVRPSANIFWLTYIEKCKLIHTVVKLPVMNIYKRRSMDMRWRRTLRSTSRRSSTGTTARHGTALWAGTSVHL